MSDIDGFNYSEDSNLGSRIFGEFQPAIIAAALEWPSAKGPFVVIVSLAEVRASDSDDIHATVEAVSLHEFDLRTFALPKNYLDFTAAMSAQIGAIDPSKETLAIVFIDSYPRFFRRIIID